jgi:hypothetical protein
LLLFQSSSHFPVRWSSPQADFWYASQGWILGANFVPSTASNQLEMWQAETFDPVTIDRELGYAQQLGMNSMRVFLHNLLWRQDAAGFLEHIDQFLQIADGHHIRITFVLFDGCWNPQPRIGRQPEPRPFVHNSTWVQSPGRDLLDDESRWETELRPYVVGILGHFRNDKRILMWDLYNEPDNPNEGSYADGSTKPIQALKLLQESFEWARSENPSQPLTSGLWIHSLPAIARFQVEHSDVITFHNYDRAPVMEAQIRNLRRFHRPLICTEYMARPAGSTFQSILLLLKREGVGGYSWGLVAGRTQTIFPWDSWTHMRREMPKVWFHDVLRANGQPYDASEVALVRQLTQ